MKFKTAYGAKPRKPFQPTGLSMTKQSFKTECDINHLLKRYQKTGLIEHVSKHNGDYSDLYDVTDYHTAINIVLDAQNSFNTLPSSLRSQFNNDPAIFLDFVSNPENSQKLIDMGLANPIAPQPEPDLSGTGEEANTIPSESETPEA